LSFLRCGCLRDTQRYDKSLVRATSILAKVLNIETLFILLLGCGGVPG
jgi:hypothetical protein